MLKNRSRQCMCPGNHKGRIHAYEAKKIAEADGSPVSKPLETEFLICEGHYPDKDDPKFTKCRCRLCIEERLLQDEVIEAMDGE